MTYVVTEHIHDETAGIYRLAVSAQTTTSEVVDGEPVEVMTYAFVRDFVWDDSDPQWFTGTDRRPDADIAAEQRSVAAAILAAVDTTPLAPVTAELPGVGDPL